MPTTTVADLITSSLRRLGVHPAGEAVEADEADDALSALNLLLETWGAQRRFVYRRQALSYVTQAGVGSVTIGPGGNIPATRPLSIRECYYRIGTIDYPVEVLYADQYALIGLKSLQTAWPVGIYYDPGFPLGVVFMYPIPAASGELHLQVDQQFTPFTAVTDVLSLPPGYTNALIYALGAEICSEYGKTLPPEYVSAWQRAESTLAKVNHRPVIAPVDPRLPGSGIVDPQWIHHAGFR